MSTLPKTVKLKQNTDFRRAYGRGKSFSEPALVTYVLKNNRAGVCRVGITTGKKIGNAVMRNRCRRVIAAAFRELEGEISGNWDIVFVARYKTGVSKSTKVREIMRKQLKSEGVIR